MALQEIVANQQLKIIGMEAEIDQLRNFNQQQQQILENQDIKIAHLRCRDKHHTSLLSACKCKTPLYKVLLTNDNAVKFYTGFVNFETFIGIFQLVKTFVAWGL